MEEITYLMKLEVLQKLNTGFQIAGKNITFFNIVNYYSLFWACETSPGQFVDEVDFKKQCLGREVRNSEPHRNNSSQNMAPDLVVLAFGFFKKQNRRVLVVLAYVLIS